MYKTLTTNSSLLNKTPPDGRTMLPGYTELNWRLRSIILALTQPAVTPFVRPALLFFVLPACLRPAFFLAAGTSFCPYFSTNTIDACQHKGTHRCVAPNYTHTLSPMLMAVGAMHTEPRATFRFHIHPL